MKKVLYLLATAAVFALTLVGCNREDPEKEKDDPNIVGTFKISDVVDAAATAYKTWEETESFAETIKVSDKDLTLPQYQYAICQALANIGGGKTDDIKVKSVKAADHPERDSYENEKIAVTNGPKIEEGTEDLVSVATRMLERMDSELKVPNQTVFTRGGTSVAFSTNRATTVISRELANYKANGKLDSEVSASYKGAGSSIKAFAQQYVKILDVWEKNVGTLDRLSNWELAQEDDKDIVENAHYVPTDYTIQFGEQILTTGDMLEIALRSYLLLRGYDGNDTDAVGFGTFPTVTPVSMSAPVPATHQYGWNMPLIETSNGGYLYKMIDGLETYGQVDPVILDNWAQRSLNWAFTHDLKFTNFCTYPREPITNYGGCFSSGRALLTYAFFFKYMLDNNLEKADNLGADVVIRSELFGIDTAGNDNDIKLKTSELEFESDEQTKEAGFVANKAWTATASESWITVDPSNGEAGDITIKITCAANTGDAREGKVIVKGGNITEGLEIIVKQAKYIAPSTATIKDFAQEYVKIIDAWYANVGTINRLSNWALATDADKDIVENAHYVPNDFTIEVGGRVYNTADMLEAALRSYLLLRGWDGNETEKAGWGNFPTTTPVSMSETTVPATHEFKFGSPLIESSNGGYLYKVVDGKEVYGQADPVILDNWAQRSLNWAFTHDKVITNLCGYPRDPITNYGGCFSSGRALLTYAFFFKYMLENGLDKADGLGADVVIRSELFGLETATEYKPTIKDFAKEYVKILNIWQNNVGSINRLSDWKLAVKGDKDVVENAHYIPNGTTIIVGNKTYTTGDMLETALRSYLLLRGWDGNETEKAGWGNFPTTTPVAMSTTEIPATHDFVFGTPLIETSNGGYLYKTVDGKEVYGQADPVILDNWAQRSLNWAFTHDKVITNFCGYPRDPITNYGGCFSSGRALLTYAFFFKYMLDNNLDKADGLGADVVIRSELFGIETASQPADDGVIKTADQLIAYLADPSKDAELGANIDLSGKTFTPGKQSGTFDGKNFTITFNAEVTDRIPAEVPEGTDKALLPEANVGLFSFVGGTVKNLKTAGSLKFSAEAGSGTYHVGGIAGYVEGTGKILNCVNGVNVLADTKCTHHLGGIAGFTAAGASITGCVNNGKVEMIIPDKGAANASQVGGIIGHIEGKAVVDGCTNNAQITWEGTGTPRQAGICGYINNLVDVKFIDCTNKGDIVWNEGNYNASSWSYVGGLTGYYGTPTKGGVVLYENCTNEGNVICNINDSKTKARVGGIAGHAGIATNNDAGIGEGEISYSYKNCVNNGDITTTSTTANNFLGGIVGYSEVTALLNIEGCTNNAALTVAGKGTAGAILGRNCSVKSTFTDVKVGKDTKLALGNPDGAFIGLIVGWQPLITTAITGKVAGGTLVKGSETIEITAANFADYLLGKDSQALGEGGSITGVTFGE